MLSDGRSGPPDGDIILRALGPPTRDFRVHKLILSLASPVFKDMFSFPQQTSDVTKLAIVEVTDPPHALDIILRMIYPFTPPSFEGNLDVLVECLIIADKYDLRGPKARLYHALAQSNVTQSLRVYAIASRFGFANIVASSARRVLSTIHLPGIPELPDDFKFVPATVYHKLIKHHASYQEAVVEVIKQTPLESKCHNCPGWKSSTEEVFRLRLSHLIITGTPVDAEACFGAWVEAYGYNADCGEDCVLKFICSVIARVDRGLVKPCVSPLQRKKVLRRKA